MKAQAIVCDEKQNFELADVVLPDPGPDDIVVRALYSGISIGTEFALIRNKLSWGPYPLCTGYQATGVAERVGDNVKGLDVGDKVYYRNQTRMNLTDGTAITAASGTHCSVAVMGPGAPEPLSSTATIWAGGMGPLRPSS